MAGEGVVEQQRIARHLEAEGDNQGAQQALERAVAADPRSAEVRAELAGFFLRRENWDGADRVAREALAIDDSNSEAHRVLGMLYAVRSEDRGRTVTPAQVTGFVRQAIDHLEKVVENPSGLTDINLQYTLGRLYLRAGQADKAIASLSRVVGENPGSVQARVSLAQAFPVKLDWTAPKPGAAKAASGAPLTTHQWYDGTQHPWEFKRVWHIEPSLEDPDTAYAGVEDAAIFVTRDGGRSWQELSGLRGHPTGAQWMPGAGGMGVHTILLDPVHRGRMYVAISAAGVDPSAVVCLRVVTWLRSTSVEWRSDLRPNASSCCVISPARRQVSRICTASSCGPVPGTVAVQISSALPMMAVSMLLKSCATPPARLPRLSIFCACSNCCSIIACSSAARFNRVMSRLNTETPNTSPSLVTGLSDTSEVRRP